MWDHARGEAAERTYAHTFPSCLHEPSPKWDDLRDEIGRRVHQAVAERAGRLRTAADVDRLTELSRDMVPKAVPLDSIDEVDSVYWFNELQRPTVRNVIEHVRLIQRRSTSPSRSSWE